MAPQLAHTIFLLLAVCNWNSFLASSNAFRVSSAALAKALFICSAAATKASFMFSQGSETPAVVPALVFTPHFGQK